MTETAIAPMRACSKCGVEKPLTDEHYHRMSGGAGKPRKPYPGYCRDCYRAREREYQATRYVEKRGDVLANMNAYRAANPEKVAEWEARRPDRTEYNAARKKRIWAAMTADERLDSYEKLKAWKRANPDKVAEVTRRTFEKHREARTAYRLQWARDNPVAVAANRDRRRAKLMGANGSYSKDDVRDLLKTQGRFCRYCQTPLTKFHVDHFIPLARGGSNWPSNLVLSCPPCNFSKADKMPWVFRPNLFKPPE